MKIGIRNLGVIQQAEIDLKPFTVFVGCNNTGKTWTAYTLSAIFGNYGYQKYLEAYLAGKAQVKYSILEDAVQQLIDRGNAKIDLVEFAERYINDYLNDVARLAPQWLPIFMGTQSVNFDDLEIDINLTEQKEAVIEKIKSFQFNGNIPISQIQQLLLDFTKEKSDKFIYFYTSSQGDLLDQLPEKVIRRNIINWTLQILHKALYINSPIFPTERTTYITWPSMASQFPSSQTQQEVLGTLPKPILPQAIEMFLNMVIRVSRISKLFKLREEQINDNPIISTYIKLADFLEESILEGKLHFKEVGIDKELFFKPSENIRLEIPVVSSMVKEIAPLVLYLRYLAYPTELIVIDEPEMNLHPSAQVEIAEFLSIILSII